MKVNNALFFKIFYTDCQLMDNIGIYRTASGVQQVKKEAEAVEKPSSPVQQGRRSKRVKYRRALRLSVRDSALLIQEGKGKEELWLFFRHAPLKDYSCKASAFNSCTDSSEPITTQTVGDQGGLKDVSACEAPEHICHC